jgi:spore coat protein U-like protein
VRSPPSSSALALVLLLATAPADAVHVREGKGCEFISLPGIDFGAYDEMSSSQATSTMTIIIKCKGVGSGEVTLSASPGATGGDYQDRRMRNVGGDATLQYQLYTDVTRRKVWGDGSGSTSVVYVVQSGSSKDVTIYGAMPPGQDGEVGQYGDIITVTVLP